MTPCCVNKIKLSALSLSFRTTQHVNTFKNRLSERAVPLQMILALAALTKLPDSQIHAEVTNMLATINSLSEALSQAIFKRNYPFNFRSSASRKPSPNKLELGTVRKSQAGIRRTCETHIRSCLIEH